MHVIRSQILGMLHVYICVGRGFLLFKYLKGVTIGYALLGKETNMYKDHQNQRKITSNRLSTANRLYKDFKTIQGLRDTFQILSNPKADRLSSGFKTIK